MRKSMWKSGNIFQTNKRDKVNRKICIKFRNKALPKSKNQKGKLYCSKRNKKNPSGSEIFATFLCIRKTLTLPSIIVSVFRSKLFRNYSHPFPKAIVPPTSPKLLNSEKELAFFLLNPHLGTNHLTLSSKNVATLILSFP